MKTKRIAFIGTGGISNAHLGCLKHRKDVEIAAMCDVNEEKLHARQKEFGGEAFTDVAQMLDRVKPAAVWVCTPPTVRRDPLIACAERGIHVFCEKPVERDLARAEALAKELRALNAKVQIGYVFRSTPIVRRVQEEKADDRIHLVQSFYGCNIGLTRGLPAWFYDKAASGGALIDQATHNLDLLRLLCGEVRHVRGLAANPVHSKAEGYTIDEVISLACLFEDGTAGAHVHSWVGDGWRNEITLFGEKRVYRLDLGRGILTIDDGPSTRIWRQDTTNIYHYENERFLKMLDSGDWCDNPSDYNDGLRTLRLTLDADAALTTSLR